MLASFKKYGFWVVLTSGLTLRIGWWFKNGGLFTRERIFDVDGYLQTGRFMLEGNWEKILSFRPTQLSYPVLLLPVHFFKWDAAVYVLGLHLLLTAFTIVLVYISAEKLFGTWAALGSAALIAFNYRMTIWFNWLYTEVIYYFGVSLFVWVSLHVWEKRFRLSILAWFSSAVFLFFIKPESISLIAVSSTVLLYQVFRVRLTPTKSVLTVFAVIFAFGASVVAALVNPTIQDKFLTHIHVAHGLFLSTTTGANRNGIEQELSFVKRAQLPYYIKEIDGRRAMSLAGISFIKENPFQYIRLCYLRMTSILFPALYFNWKPLSRIQDFLFSLVFVFGSLLCLRVPTNNRVLIVGVVLCALGMLALTSVYLADGDTRFRLPIYVVLSIVAPAGILYCLEGKRSYGN